MALHAHSLLTGRRIPDRPARFPCYTIWNSLLFEQGIDPK